MEKDKALELFKCYKEVFGAISEHKENIFKKINLDDMQSDVESIDTYSGRFSVSMKMHSCYICSEDILECSKEMNDFLKDNPDNKQDILDSLKKLIDDEQHMLYYISQEREQLEERLDIDAVKHSVVLLKEKVLELYSKDRDAAKEYAGHLLKESKLKRALDSIAIDFQFSGSSGGYFTPLDSDYFEDMINEVSNFKDNFEDNEECFYDTFREHGVEINNGNFIFEGRSVPLKCTDEKRILEFMNFLNKAGIGEDSSCVPSIDIVNGIGEECCEDADYAEEAYNDFTIDMEALSYILSISENYYNEANTKEGFKSFFLESGGYQSFLEDMLEEYGHNSKNTDAASKSLKI